MPVLLSSSICQHFSSFLYCWNCTCHMQKALLPSICVWESEGLINFWIRPGNMQGLLLTLHWKIEAVIWVWYGILGIEPGSVKCKASSLYTVLSFWSQRVSLRKQSVSISFGCHRNDKINWYFYWPMLAVFVIFNQHLVCILSIDMLLSYLVCQLQVHP